MRGLNSRPPAHKTGALPAELIVRFYLFFKFVLCIGVDIIICYFIFRLKNKNNKNIII